MLSGVNLAFALCKYSRGKMMRKRWLLLVTSALVITAAGSSLHAQQKTTLPNGVAAGDVTQTSAVLWAHSTATGKVTFDVATDSDFAQTINTLTADISDATIPVKVSVDGLAPGKQYYYRVTDAAGNTVQGKFRTPAASGTKTGLRFGVSGDWRGELAPYSSISNAAGENLDFFVEFGDTIYADYPSPDVPKDQAKTLGDFRAKHNEVYSERYGMNTWQDLRESTSVLATIDDHEVANDFAGGAVPATDKRFAGDKAPLINETTLFKNGIQVFEEYNPIRDETYGDTGDPRTANKVKLYRYVTYGDDAAVILLDERTFRDGEVPPVQDLGSRIQAFAFLAAAYNPQRTMLGKAQLDDTKADLLKAQKAGITWKFVLVPEPIQNLGIVNAGDRYEGYAAERADLLKFIVDNQISNVVFVTADIHGTLVNDVTYATGPLAPQIPTGTFEISTGPVAYDAPFGPTVVDLAASLNLLTKEQVDAYNKMSEADKEKFMATAINAQVQPLKYSLIGLDDSNIPAKLIKGDYLATTTYGWTLFEIDKDTQMLTITTYGIPYYTEKELDADPKGVTSRTPEIVSQFTVQAK
jgi:3-phytase/alkaline phosphatase D